jgi:hypothetical protein
MSVSINGTNGLTFNDGSTQTTAATGFGFKNRLINGDMRIDQRNAGASQAVTTSNAYCVDRWSVRASTGSGHTVQQTTTAPAGFTNSLRFTTGTGASPAAGDVNWLLQPIEGFNAADFAWGTASAVSVTIGFLVRSSLTGTFGGAVQNNANNRSYPFTYTISAANTFEYKTVTIPGDTTGTWLTNNSTGLFLYVSMGMGSNFRGTSGAWAGSDFRGATGETNVVGTSGATFFLTGVQLEKGSTATSFDYRPYGTELALCQRYYQLIGSGASGVTQASNAVTVGWINRVEMRAAPTVALYSTALKIRQDGSASFTSSGSTMPDVSADQYGGWAVVNGFTGLTTTRSAITFPTTAAFTLSIEL